MIKYIVIIAAVLAAIIIGISWYLSPDDLAACADAPSDESACQPADAIVAISGGDTPTRTRAAVDLYQRGWAPTIVFAGAAEDKSGPSNALSMRREAIQLGVPADAIIIEEQSENTKENAANIEQLLRDEAIDDIILVTSAYHMRRSSIAFSAELPDVTIRRAPTDGDWSAWWWLSPRGWYLGVSETIKSIVLQIQVGVSS